MIKNNTCSPFTWRFWPAYIIQMRPYLLFVSGVAGLTGIAAAATEQTSLFKIGLSFFPLFLGYGFGQALTDCFQLDTDRISAPYRPLSKGIISAFHVKIISITGLLAGVGLLVFLNPWNILTGILSVTGLATYTFFKRRYWFAGPLWNGWIVALLPLMGYLSISGEGLSGKGNQVFPLVLLSFFTYTHFVITGYLKDIRADRATGYKTFPVIFGWNATVSVSDFFVIAGAFVALNTISGPYPSLVWGAGTFMALSGQLYAHFTANKTEENTAFPVGATVRAFIIWHLAVILHYQPSWWALLLIFYLLFEWAMYRRPERNQI